MATPQVAGTSSAVPVQPADAPSNNKWAVAMAISVLVLGTGIFFAVQNISALEVVKHVYVYAPVIGSGALAFILSTYFFCKKNSSDPDGQPVVSPQGAASPARAPRQHRHITSAQLQQPKSGQGAALPGAGANSGAVLEVSVDMLDKGLPPTLIIPRIGIEIDPAAFDGIEDFDGLKPITKQLQAAVAMFF